MKTVTPQNFHRTRTKTKTMYNSIQEIKQVAKAGSLTNQWSEFFSTKIGRKVYRGHYFITSEKMDYKHQRRYTVKMCVDGKISTVGNWQNFATRRQAISYICSLPDKLPQAFKLAWDSFQEKNRKFQDNTHINVYACEKGSIEEACTYLLQNWSELGVSFAFVKYIAKESRN